ncbi:MAG: hypothetical protein ABI354_02735 [Candidatus Saccharimonadales bacterium]
MKRLRSRALPLLVTIIVAVFAGGLWVEHWQVYDYFRLRNYNPSSRVVQLADDTTLNNSTRRLFYVNHPELDDKSTFTEHCLQSEKTIVLGCFVPGQGIYIYNVTDSRLQGIVQVTAAHETLHAAYQRLSGREKQRVDDLINQAYKQVDDQRIRATVEDYRKNGADVTNELHSILGTEVRNLPPELEQYYKRYFTDRGKIVSYSEHYEAVFSARKVKIAKADKRLTELKSQIDTTNVDLDAQSAQLKATKSQLEALAQSKQYQTYNAAVPDYNASVRSFNSTVKSVQDMIDEYNALVKERNDAVVEEGQLIKAIDSRPSTVPTE